MTDLGDADVDSPPGSTDEPDSSMNPEVLYSDRFIAVSASGTLSIAYPNYLAPHPSKPRIVNLSTIACLDLASEVCPAVFARSWGPSRCGIVWARDWRRGLAMFGNEKGLAQYRRSWVVKVKGKLARVGFTVERGEDFLQAVEKACPGISSKHQKQSRDGYARLGDA